jgi:hypothetical protein
MNTKWYLGALLIILALIGLNQEQTKAANQQIVLQFSEADKTSVTAQEDALATIIAKLQNLGIDTIELIENDGTQLSIRYYSSIDALSVGDFLSAGSDFSLTYKDVLEHKDDFPSEELPDSFNLVVTDLHQSNDGFGANGKFAFELNQDYNRFSNPVVYQFNDALVLNQDATERVAYKISGFIAIAIDHISFIIPEVRAGPVA